uniref:RNA helicase n=1 Tax=Palpitomonas bilix TaxID=652834 RepID=A0A7S3CYQ8_9EUKA|mmetsp:Transcript_15027/g.38002  ORF Transcript_15027/g.38002 Transcript_15027/m.38002 type:complete len:687 (+) Transcript_15027:8-2068(+)
MSRTPAPPPSMLDTSVTFEDLGLDPRLRKAVARMNLLHPSLIQAQSIPLALQGKDILARAKTGSGKTLAYALPVVQKLLSLKEAGALISSSTGVSALIVVPTKELVDQVRRVIKEVTHYCHDMVRVLPLASDQQMGAQKAKLMSARPDIIVGTPGRIAQHLRVKNISLQDTLEIIVIDEADLVLSYGNDEDVQYIAQSMPKTAQAYLMSATLNKDVEKLKNILLNNPIYLKVEDGKDGGKVPLSQYFIECDSEHKFVIVLAMMKLQLLVGKTIFFVNTIDRGFKLKLFLEKFGIRVTVLNSELPQNSRAHIIEEFNRGVFDYIIATDNDMAVADNDAIDLAEKLDDETFELVSDDEEGEEDMDEEEGEEEEMDQGEGEKEEEESHAERLKDKQASTSSTDAKQGKDKKSKSKKRHADIEYSASRGVDFKRVSVVINFDVPDTTRGYIHRIGRTARGGATGTAITFAEPHELAFIDQCREEQLKDAADKLKPTVQQKDGEVTLEAHHLVEGEILTPLPLNMNDVDNFKYRASDMLKSLTKTRIREARLKEIKNELLNSELLHSHFEDNPKDLNLINHDAPLQRGPTQSHLKAVPSYLVPASVKMERKRQKKGSRRGQIPDAIRAKARAKGDPLRTLEYAPADTAVRTEPKPELLPSMWTKRPSKDKKGFPSRGGKGGKGIKKTNKRR